MEQRHSELTTALPGNPLEREVADLYARHAGELLHYAALLLHRHDGASDAVQETFLRYFAERKCGGTIEFPRAWLYRVLHNHLRDRWDRASFKYEVSAVRAAEPVDAARNPEEILCCSQAAREIAAELTGREMDCLRLRAEGLSYQEVAGLLGVRSGTVGCAIDART